MRHGRILIGAAFLLAGAIAGAIVSAQAPAAQGPPGGAPPGQGRGGPPAPPPTNLQVLPKDMPRQQLLPIMQVFAQALGVTCAHCHDWEQGRATNDMASDAKPAKNIARAMMRMVGTINPAIQAAVATKAATDVRAVGCWTCHRGAVIPDAPPALPARGGGPPPGAGGPPAGAPPAGRGN
jgi:hypothetical protein